MEKVKLAFGVALVGVASVMIGNYLYDRFNKPKVVAPPTAPAATTPPAGS